MNDMTPVVKQLLIINIIVFIGCQLMGTPAESNAAYQQFSLFYFENPHFKVWQPLTSMFMHAPLPNIMHIAFNMIALVSFGSMLEHFWGAKKFLFFYLSCGVGAFLLHTGVNYYFFHHGLDILVNNGFQKDEILSTLNEGKFNTRWEQLLPGSEFQNFTDAYFGTAVGASGAIYGLLVAFAFMFPSAELALFFIPLPIKAKYVVPGLIAIDLFMGIKGSSLFGDNTGGGIAHFAHVGGALFGFIMMLVWKNQKFHHNRWS
ncbi:MAG: rhomboid family intramembrane serine protease [Flavobacterium sp. BFFFF1]|uniref:rhomboid family intramembrane serine protease n=1 Tax=Flavobacterium sp. BFFFF1 TaxID=2015557 RepID=UPI000BD7C76B|nr:rhomboid family intramembrane serine protease [Flavobacterium sp. BFFFF1]OYU80612.1 MAG: rhomboid family intramembrane serine protease [Flavobacterium sp. BFFFF1]